MKRARGAAAAVRAVRSVTDAAAEMVGDMVDDAVANAAADARAPAPPLPVGESWFAARGWQPFAFQREVWAAMAAGESGLLHATTGSGKTYAVWFGALARAAALGVPAHGTHPPPLGVLWLTPMRALAADSARAIRAPIEDLGMAWSVGIRTGDTPSAERAQAGPALPDGARHHAGIALADADAREGEGRARRRSTP